MAVPFFALCILSAHFLTQFNISGFLLPTTTPSSTPEQLYQAVNRLPLLQAMLIEFLYAFPIWSKIHINQKITIHYLVNWTLGHWSWLSKRQVWRFIQETSTNKYLKSEVLYFHLVRINMNRQLHLWENKWLEQWNYVSHSNVVIHSW